MMRGSPLSLVAAAAALVLIVPQLVGLRFVGSQAKADEKEANNLAKDLVGTWALAGTPGEVKEPPAKGARLKFISSKSWTVTQADPDSGVVVFHHGGTFKLDGDKYTESVEYANDSTKDLIGKTFHFKIKVEGDTLTQEGTDNSWNEVWKRVK
jgi:hypothetical protein